MLIYYNFICSLATVTQKFSNLLQNFVEKEHRSKEILMFLERFHKTYKYHFESFRFLLIGYSKTNCRLKFELKTLCKCFKSN